MVVDSSALVSVLLREPASDAVGALLGETQTLVLSAVTLVEVRSALARARHSGRVTARTERRLWDDFRQTWESSGVLCADDELLADAGELAARHVLRAYDAIQLATGLLAASDLGTRRFLTLDDDLRAAADREGLLDPLREAP